MSAKFHVSESTAITQVVTRLTETFTPTVPGPHVSETVQRIHHRFDDSKVRDFHKGLTYGCLTVDVLSRPQKIDLLRALIILLTLIGSLSCFDFNVFVFENVCAL